jgi:hypothetical protein
MPACVSAKGSLPALHAIQRNDGSRVVGFDDLDLSEFTIPSLTTVKTPAAASTDPVSLDPEAAAQGTKRTGTETASGAYMAPSSRRQSDSRIAYFSLR